MKTIKQLSIIATLALSLLTLESNAQSPDLFNYQGIARNAAGAGLQNQAIGLQITIRETNTTGSIVYQETHAPTTNQFGLFTVQVGTGTVVSGDITTIDWAGDLHFMQVEMDETGGTNYADMGTQQLISVPYAKHASTVENDNVDDADNDPTNEHNTGINLNGTDLEITDGGGTLTEDLSSLVDDADADPTNELQDLSINGDTIFITGGDSVIIPTGGNDGDWTINGNNIHNANTGNVGINETNPTTAKLVISGTAGQQGLDMSTSDQYANMRVIQNSNSTIDNDLYLGHLSGNSSSVFLYSNNFETVRVEDQKVGINTTSPAEALDVAGNATVDQLNINNAFTFPTADGTNGQVLTTDGAGAVTWQAAGGGDGNGIYDGSGSLSGNTTVTGGSNTLDFNTTVIDGFSVDGFTFSVDGANDRVGIGTVTPTERLHVNGNIRVNDNDLYLRADTNHGIGWYGSGKLFNGNNIDGPVVYGFNGGVLGTRNGSTEVDVLHWRNNGNVGIGSVTPNSKLQVVGKIYSTGTAAEVSTQDRTNSKQYTMYGDQDLMRFWRSDALDVMVINSSGNVGIGTTAPSEELDVVGTATIDTVNINSAFTLPSADGTNGQVLTTDGSGNVSWQAAGGNDGNGIYDGSGSLSGNTTVAQGINTLGFTSSSVNGFSVDGATFSVDAANNRVGVGIIAPAAKLDVNGLLTAGSASALFRNGDNNGGGANFTQLQFGFNGGNTFKHYITTWHNSSGPALNKINFYTSDGTSTGSFPTNAVHGLTIEAGKAGVGTISPVNTLDVEGGAAIGASYSGSSTAPTNGAIIEGNVGIGTTTPNYRLHSHTDVNTVHQFTTTATGTTVNDGLLIGNNSLSDAFIIQREAANLFIRTSNVDRMTINAAGNVGIGTTSPQGALHVSGPIGANSWTYLQGNAASTNPSTSVNSGLIYGWNSSNGNGESELIWGTGAGVNPHFYLSTWDGSTKTARVMVANNGSVGIGTTAPTEMLHVVGNICATGTIAVCSDKRYKKNIAQLPNALENVMAMRGVSYNWKTSKYKDMGFTDEKQVGFIAQELEEFYPEVVVTDDKGYKTVDYSKLTPVLVEAIKEQQRIINEQKNQLSIQGAEMDEMKADIEMLKQATETTVKAQR